MSDPSNLDLRKADFWTSLVLIALGSGMVLKALSMPLEGTYAGVRNVWYVSPALMPIGVGAGLIVLAAILLLNAVRCGGASAALGGLGRTFSLRLGPETVASITVVGLLANYIYILIPRTDFIAATTLTLFALTATFDLGSARATLRVLAITALLGVGIAAAAALGFSPEPRSLASHLRDAVLWLGVATAIASAALAVRGEAGPRSRLRRCVAVSLLVPLVLGTVFKYGFLSPLPYEGLTVEALERVRFAAAALLSP